MGFLPHKYYMTIKTSKPKISGKTSRQKHITLHKVMFFHAVESTQSFIKCELPLENSLNFKT